MTSPLFRDLKQPYLVYRDEHTRVWRILDTAKFGSDILDPEYDVPDTHPGVTFLTEGAFIELIKTATRLGVLQNIIEAEVVPIAEYQQLASEKKVLEEEIQNLRETPLGVTGASVVFTEAYNLASKKLDTLIKLANLGMLNPDFSQDIMRLGGNLEVKNN